MTLSLDTNAYTMMMRPRESLRQCVLQADPVCISTVVLGELYAGFLLGTQYAQNLADLSEFLASPGVEVIPVTHSIAERYGTIVRQLKEQARRSRRTTSGLRPRPSKPALGSSHTIPISTTSRA